MAGKHRRAIITAVSVPIVKGLAREDDSSRASPFTSPSFFQVSLKSLALQEDSRRPFLPEKKEAKKFYFVFSSAREAIASNQDWRIPQKQSRRRPSWS